MIVSTMSDEQIAAEARKDYYEVYGKARIAFDRFIKTQKKIGTDDIEGFMQLKTIQKQTYTTRNRNTWTAIFYNVPNSANSEYVSGSWFMYLTLPFEHGNDFLVMKDRRSPVVERLSCHFCQRYRERHLEPFGINIGNTPVAVHFVMNNFRTLFRGDKFYGKELNIRKDDTRGWWITDEGMFITEDNHLKKHILIYVTFIDLSNMREYQQALHEEEKAWNLMNRIEEAIEGGDIEKKNALFTQLTSPNSQLLLERYIQRNFPEKASQLIDFLKIQLQEMGKLTKKINASVEAEDKELKRLLRVV